LRASPLLLVEPKVTYTYVIIMKDYMACKCSSWF
jgi:hypothetical protein